MHSARSASLLSTNQALKSPFYPALRAMSVLATSLATAHPATSSSGGFQVLLLADAWGVVNAEQHQPALTDVPDSMHDAARNPYH